jgi:predicted Rossmann fold flavoprotein
MTDIAIVGAGAAGLAAAIFTARRSPRLSILVFDGARKPGAKILISGGGRCNVTNAEVTEAMYFGGPRSVIRRVLRSLSVPRTAEFFRSVGVTLHEEEDGKLFPDSNRASTVLEALLKEVGSLGVGSRWGERVLRIDKTPEGFRLQTTAGTHLARRAVLATGGRSLPKSGSDGAGYAMATALGHTLIPTTPALEPLLLRDNLHEGLSGTSLRVQLHVHAAGRKRETIAGPLLWTHFGISGPAPMNASRLWHRARLEGREARLTACFLPEADFTKAENLWLKETRAGPSSSLRTALSRWMPQRMADALLDHLKLPAQTPMGQCSRATRRELLHALTAWPLPVEQGRGYNHAEATAGGIPLSEIDPSTMESKKCPGLHLVGEILDVDGRIGGYNFQWAWASGCAASLGLSKSPFWITHTSRSSRREQRRC